MTSPQYSILPSFQDSYGELFVGRPQVSRAAWGGQFISLVSAPLFGAGFLFKAPILGSLSTRKSALLFLTDKAVENRASQVGSADMTV